MKTPKCLTQLHTPKISYLKKRHLGSSLGWVHRILVNWKDTHKFDHEYNSEKTFTQTVQLLPVSVVSYDQPGCRLTMRVSDGQCEFGIHNKMHCWWSGRCWGQTWLTGQWMLEQTYSHNLPHTNLYQSRYAVLKGAMSCTHTHTRVFPGQVEVFLAGEKCRQENWQNIILLASPLLLKVSLDQKRKWM